MTLAEKSQNWSVNGRTTGEAVDGAETTAARGAGSRAEDVSLSVTTTDHITNVRRSVGAAQSSCGCLRKQQVVHQPATVLIILSPKLLPDAFIGASICVNITKKAQQILVRMSVNVWSIFHKVL